ncbi:MAG: MucBP domain-containing protein [Tannerellaceae bacterium]|jgi:hypothetical protein|nr:MucBP domain-containing protein [Tannerellaceae bacterium]
MKHLINILIALLAITAISGISGCVFDPIYDPGSVTIKYIDAETDKEIRDAKLHDRLPAAKYTYEHPEIEGYVFNAQKSDPGTVELALSEKATVRFYYNRVKQSVTIRYLDSETDEEIRVETVHSDVPVGKYTYTHPAIEGWAFNAEKSDSGTGDIERGENIVIRFYYSRQQQTITVRYLDSATDKDILSPTVYTNVPAGEYSYTPPAIEGWAFNAEKSDSGTGTIGWGESIVIRFYYDRMKQTITIRYLDAATDKEIQPATVHDNVPVGAYSYTPPVIDGWKFNTQKSDPGTGTIEAGQDIVIRFYYDRLRQSITIRYLENGTDRELRETTVHTDVPVGAYSYTPPAITGYTFNSGKSDPGVGTIAAGQSIVIRFYYDKVTAPPPPPEPPTPPVVTPKQSITIRYLATGSTDEEIQPPVTYKNVPVGAYSYTAPVIEGYAFSAADSDPETGTIGAGENLTITFRYHIELTVIHMLENDNGDYEERYTSNPLASIGDLIACSNYAYKIPGYTFDHSIPVQIAVSKEEKTITLYYTRENS